MAGLIAHKTGSPRVFTLRWAMNRATKQQCVTTNEREFLMQNPRLKAFKANRPGVGVCLIGKVGNRQHKKFCKYDNSFNEGYTHTHSNTTRSDTSESCCVSEERIKKWFIEGQGYMKENKMEAATTDLSRIFGGDETGFRPSTVDVPSTKRADFCVQQ
jgi:hypothetical protein